ncbi:MAG: hypothetical protein HY021_15220 [Burkholderiales bacterium]|nr:hypothetical protein [Burkholderiales bacterium]
MKCDPPGASMQQALDALDASRTRLRAALLPAQAPAHAGPLLAWWHDLPWRVPLEGLAAAARQWVEPRVRQHPLAAVLAAGALGVLAAMTRPWRWLPLMAGASAWAATQLGQPAVQSALAAAVLSAMRQMGERPGGDPPAPPAP